MSHSAVSQKGLSRDPSPRTAFPSTLESRFPVRFLWWISSSFCQPGTTLTSLPFSEVQPAPQQYPDVSPGMRGVFLGCPIAALGAAAAPHTCCSWVLSTSPSSSLASASSPTSVIGNTSVRLTAPVQMTVSCLSPDWTLTDTKLVP